MTASGDVPMPGRETRVGGRVCWMILSIWRVQVVQEIFGAGESGKPAPASFLHRFDGGNVRQQRRERQRLLVGDLDQKEAYRVGNGQTHVGQDGGRFLLDGRVDASLDELVFSHGSSYLRHGHYRSVDQTALDAEGLAGLYADLDDDDPRRRPRYAD